MKQQQKWCANKWKICANKKGSSAPIDAIFMVTDFDTTN